MRYFTSFDRLLKMNSIYLVRQIIGRDVLKLHHFIKHFLQKYETSCILILLDTTLVTPILHDENNPRDQLRIAIQSTISLSLDSLR